MNIEIVFILMLFIHTLADFYFQTDELAKKKEDSLKALLCHLLQYFLCSLVLGAALFRISKNSFLLIILLSITHGIVDFIKYCFRSKNCHIIFYLDQLAHLIRIFIIWFFVGKQIDSRDFLMQRWNHLPFLPITMLLGITLVLKPVSIMIEKSGLLQSKNSNGNGKIIGYLERLIILGLIMYGEFSAIGFVITAKSITRFSETQNDAQKAEYYIIGTLLSVSAAVVTAILLGLCPMS